MTAGTVPECAVGLDCNSPTWAADIFMRKARLSASSPVSMPAVVESISNLARSPATLVPVEVPVPVRSLVEGFHAYAIWIELSRARTRTVKKTADTFLAETRLTCIFPHYFGDDAPMNERSRLAVSKLYLSLSSDTLLPRFTNRGFVSQMKENPKIRIMEKN